MLEKGITLPSEADLLAEMRQVDLNAPRAVAEGLRAKLDAAALEALKAGKDWAEGPMTFDRGPSLEYLFAPRSLFEPVKHTAEVRAGPVDADWQPPHGWRVIRHADWVKAGRPGA